MDKLVYGGDTETVEGEPNTLQFYSEDVACNDIFFVTPANACDTFLKWCASRRRNVLHVVYFHNLAFDLTELLWGQYSNLVSGTDFDFKIGKVRVRGVYGTPTFCYVTLAKDLTIMLVDSSSYFRGSLEKAAKLYCPDLPKLKRPHGLGEKRFNKRDSQFIDYAMRDAEVTYHIGRAVEAMHQEYDLQQCVSVADMAARIFKHKYLTYDIPQPGRDVIEAALLSYHGGKNNVTVDAGFYEGVTSLDISSAYPAAMRDLPAFSDARLYRRFNGRRVAVVPDCGVYSVTGVLAPCDWPVLFSHAFKPLSGKVDRVWVQGFELNESIRSGEFRPSKVTGWFYDRDRDHQAPALRFFCDDFYAKKESETNKIRREGQKLILNSVSGKFIQTRKKSSGAFTDIDAGVTVTASKLVAGGMFHPFIASAITAHTRARIHRLEHKYKALHTATDGIMSQTGIAGSFDGETGLGALTVEARKAELLLVRNKCYVLYTQRGPKTSPSEVFKGKHIRKFALHGFQGRVSDLERLVATGRRRYTVTKPNRLRDSVKRGLVPNLFRQREIQLKVGPIPLPKHLKRR